MGNTGLCLLLHKGGTVAGTPSLALGHGHRSCLFFLKCRDTSLQGVLGLGAFYLSFFLAFCLRVRYCWLEVGDFVVLGMRVLFLRLVLYLYTKGYF